MANKISDANIAAIISGNAKLLVDEAKRFGQELAEDRVSKNQIRGAFGTVRQIQAAWVTEPDALTAQKQLRKVLLLQPRLAYQARRDEKVKPLADVLIAAINQVAAVDDTTRQTERFTYFVDLFEAILAYHTAFGGK